MPTPNVTGQQVLVETRTIEFDSKVYFRIEILRLETGAPIQVVKCFAEVYLLCWPHGQMVMPSGQRVDTRFRQSWLFLDDFPMISGSSVNEVYSGVMAKLQQYAAAYIGEFDTRLKRGQPLP